MGDQEQYYQGANAYGAEEGAQQGNWIQCFDEETGCPYVYNDVTGETKWVDPAASEDILITLWQKFYDDNGDVFYYNPHTGESSWELPANAMVEEGGDGYHTGNEDYQFADGDHEDENIEYDGNKYIEAYQTETQRSSVLDNGVGNIFDASLEHDESQERMPTVGQLNQSSIHSTRSTKSASYIPMKLLAKKNSKDNMTESEKRTMEKKHSAQSLGIKTGSSFVLNRAPVVRDSLKPSSSSKSSKSNKLTGFALLKVGATILRKQIDENGSTWIEYQAAENGPVFYSQVDGLSAGQWNRPPIFDVEDMSSTSIVSVEPVDFAALDEALISRPSSRKDLTVGAGGGGSGGNSFQSKGSWQSGAGSTGAPANVPPAKDTAPAGAKGATQSSTGPSATAVKTLPKQTYSTPAREEPSPQETGERKNLFGSFINSVFVETVAKEDKMKSVRNSDSTVKDVTMEALFGEDSVSEKSTTVAADSGKILSDKGAMYSPDFNPIITDSAQAAARAPFSPTVVTTITTPIDLEAGLESPAERIALTPKSKLPPGSGMRKSSFSQLDYIPESQPLFDKTAGDAKTVNSESEASHSARGRLDSPAELDTSPAVGEGLAAVRAMYANARSASLTAVPFQSPAPADPVPQSPSVVETPKADLFGSQSVANNEAVSTNEGAWIQCWDEESGWPYVYNEVTGEVKWVEPESTDQLLAVLWDVCYDENGNEFYYNQATGESRWDLPTNAKLSSTNDQTTSDPTQEAQATPGLTDLASPAAAGAAASATLVDLSSPSAKASDGSGKASSPTMVAMKGLTKKASLQSLIEKKTSVGNLTPLAKKASAQKLGIRTGTAWIKSKPPEIKAELKPTVGTPKVGGPDHLTGFALLKVGAKVLDKQIDEDGETWIMYQAVDKGPVFYSKEGSDIPGQWHKPPIYRDGTEDDEAEPGGDGEKKKAEQPESTTPAPAATPTKQTSEPAPTAAPAASPKKVATPVKEPASPVPAAAPTTAVVTVAPVAEAAHTSAVPPLPLSPIVAQQPAVPAEVNAPQRMDSLDPDLYEMSGMTLDSKQNKESTDLLGNDDKELSASRQSLLQELRDMGLDEDGNLLIATPPKRTFGAAATPTNTSTAARRSTISATENKPSFGSKAAERKMSNVEIKLREMDSGVAARLVESPYAKSAHKFRDDGMNPLSVSTNRAASHDAPAAAASPTSKQRPSSSPTKRSETATSTAAANTHKATGGGQPTSHSHQAADNERPHSSPKRTQQRPTSAVQSRAHDAARNTQQGSAHASDSAEFPLSPFRNQSNSLHGGQGSLPLPDPLGSPVVGGAVKSSFLTDLGFASADTPMVADAYQPPRDVRVEVLRSELARGERMDATLRHLAGHDVNDDEATILLERLQRIAENGASVVASPGVSRPLAASAVQEEGARHPHNTSRRIIERACLLLEKIEPSATEHKVNEKQLLDVMVEQRNLLTPPRSLVRDWKAHNSLPVHCCSPQAAKHPQVEHKLETVADAGAWLVCRDPFFLSGRYFYVHKATRSLQVGEPFDFLMKKQRQALTKENWSDYDLNLTVNQHYLENVQAELLRDEHGGLLVYSAVEDQYSSTGKFDVNWAARERFAGTAGLAATSSLQLRTTAMLTRSDALRFTHPRPAASATSSRPATATVRKNEPKNVWQSFDLGKGADGAVSMGTQWMAAEQTASFNTASDFGLLLDQTALSYDGGFSQQPLDHFATMKNAFASTSAEEVIADGNQGAFASPYFDTEMLIEMAQTRNQAEPTRMLNFEASMPTDVYLQYKTHIAAIAAEPENPVPLLQLMEMLIYQGQGKPAMAAFKRAMVAMEAQSEWCLTAHEMAATRILYAKLASKYFLKYEKPRVMYALVDSFPESPFVLTHAAFYFAEMCYVEQAEMLFLGALMLQPQYDRALLAYARLLETQGNHRTALRYLGRIGEDSPMWLPAKLEMATIQELQGLDHAALVVAYKNCTYVQANIEDSSYATALYAMAYHHHKLHERDKEAFFFARALVRNPDCSMALLLSAAIAAGHFVTACGQPFSEATAHNERPRTAGASSTDAAPVTPLPSTKADIDARFRRGVLLAPKRRYRWIASLGYADYVNCVMRDTQRAEQYYLEASKISFSYSIWSTLALAHFYQYTRGEAGVAGRLLLRTLRHRHSDVPIDCLTDFNAFRHREVDRDPANEVLRFMSLPSQKATDAALEETEDDLEVAALYVVVAFYLMDLQEWEDAMKYAAAAIRINETYSPALRCIALITWQHGNTRKASLRYFSAALEFGPTNPYVLRTCAVIRAMEGHHEEAIGLLQSAHQLSPSCPLALRALAMMVYLYRKEANQALEYLQQSFALSNSEDIECLRLRGQILMDLGRFKEARAILQQALYIVPWDAVTLASLGYCVSMLPSKEQQSMRDSSTIEGNYSSRLLNLRSYEELIHSRNADELFEASVTIDLQRIFAGQANLSATGSELYAKSKAKKAVNPFGQSNGHVLSNFAVEHELEEVDADFGNNMTGYAYYWYGMHELKKMRSFNLEKCRTLFTLASKVAAPGASSSCNALALYRLGELAEREGHVDVAERHYQHAVQCEPMEPMSVLRLVGVVEQGLVGIKKMIRMLDAPRKRKGAKKSNRNHHRDPVESSGTLSTYHPPPRSNVQDSSLVNNLAQLLSTPLVAVPEVPEEPLLGDESALNGTTELTDPMNEYQRRLLVHQRIHEMATLKKRSYRKALSEAVPVNTAHHVFVDSYWLERLLHAFSTCEDWARLYKCTTQVQVKKNAKVAEKRHK